VNRRTVPSERAFTSTAVSERKFQAFACRLRPSPVTQKSKLKKEQEVPFLQYDVILHAWSDHFCGRMKCPVLFWNTYGTIHCQRICTLPVQCTADCWNEGILKLALGFTSSSLCRLSLLLYFEELEAYACWVIAVYVVTALSILIRNSFDVHWQRRRDINRGEKCGVSSSRNKTNDSRSSSTECSSLRRLYGYVLNSYKMLNTNNEISSKEAAHLL